MVISKNSQLGLRFDDLDTQSAFLKKLMEVNTDLLNEYNHITEALKSPDRKEGDLTIDIDDKYANLFNSNLSRIENFSDERKVRNTVTELTGERILIDNKNSKYFFICESVYKAAELIKIGDNFTGRTIKDISFGKYTYLMGKNRMVRFIVVKGAIKGFYYDDKNNIAFEWGIEMENGGYYFDSIFNLEFSTIMQILTFVELGDIEIKTLETGRNNGGKKNADKVTNTSNNTIYVVDSSWNQIIIRTTGFAVRGHYRLQPCGSGMIDRKLIWISAFEKDGYKRTPKASILK